MSRRTLTMTEGLYEYLLSVSLRESDVLRRLRLETETLAAGGMQISPEQGQFMTLLTELLGTRRAIEVGTFTGYSAICVASAMPADGLLICCDTSVEWTDVARRYWVEAGVDERVELRIGPAVDTLDQLLEAGQAGAFDFAFVDADKERYGAYYDRCYELLRPGGVMLFDNVLWGGSVADAQNKKPATESIRALNSRIHADARVSLSLLPLGDGVTVCRKR